MRHVEKRIQRPRHRIYDKRGRNDRRGWFQMVVRIGSSGSEAATGQSEVRSPLRNVVAWIELLIICVWRGWAVSESGLLSRSSPWARIVIKLTSLNVVNLLLNPVEKTELAKIREEPVRDWSWISQKSPSPFSNPRGTVHRWVNLFRDTSIKVWF